MHIKSNTNISELDKIIRRMENQDAEYEKLLKKVSSLEEHIVGMEKNMDTQVEREHKLLSMEGKNKSPKKDIYQGIHKDNYELLILEKAKAIERRREDEILKKKIILWIN